MAGVKHLALRKEIIRTCLAMNACGINQGSSGNVSARIRGGFLVTPSGIPYDQTKPGDVVEMSTDGWYRGSRLPSSEWRFHFDLMKERPDAGAIIHTHAPFCTTLACLHQEIPAFHYMVAVAGGDTIRCARYATFGTQALSDAALEALRGRRACLLANHGMIVLGADLAKALGLAVEVETLAMQYWRALQAGKPKILSKKEMKRVLARFKTYGKQADELRDGDTPAVAPPPRREDA